MPSNADGLQMWPLECYKSSKAASSAGPLEAPTPLPLRREGEGLVGGGEALGGGGEGIGSEARCLGGEGEGLRGGGERLGGEARCWVVKERARRVEGRARRMPPPPLASCPERLSIVMVISARQEAMAALRRLQSSPEAGLEPQCAEDQLFRGGAILKNSVVATRSSDENVRVLCKSTTAVPGR